MANNKPQIPLKEIVNSKENVYAFTNAAIKRASQITFSRSEEERLADAKITTQALTEVITHTVNYKIEDIE